MSIKIEPSEEYIQSHREYIGKSIREFREKKNYSQDNLAKIMNVHRSTISKVEKGKFSITIDYLAKFAWHLDFDIIVMQNKI